jgi:hypothetical protein
MEDPVTGYNEERDASPTVGGVQGECRPRRTPRTGEKIASVFDRFEA